MKSFVSAMAVAAATMAAPALAQSASTDAGRRLEAMTCREFIAFAPEDQMTVMLAMRAQVNGEPLPDEPLPIGTEAEIGGADGLGGDSGSPGAEGATAEAAGDGATDTADVASEAAGTAAADAAVTGEGTGDVAEVEDTVAADAGEPSPEALTAESLTEPPADPKLTAMRTSCLGGPDALATDAMRAAHADYE